MLLTVSTASTIVSVITSIIDSLVVTFITSPGRISEIVSSVLVTTTLVRILVLDVAVAEKATCLIVPQPPSSLIVLLIVIIKMIVSF